MEKVLTVEKVSGQSEKFLKSLESFRLVYKVSGHSEKFPDNLRTLVHVGKKRFTRFWHTCRENNSRTPSGKFLRVKVCQPESWDFLGL